MTARGIRQNNPGNIRPGKSRWLGELAPVDNYCVFDTPENGLRALALQLLIYEDKHDLHSIRDYIYRWAPPSDNNDTEAYVLAVADHVGFDQREVYDLHDPVKLALLVEAICIRENGPSPYTDAQLATAVSTALEAMR